MMDAFSEAEWKTLDYLTGQDGLVNIKEIAERTGVSYSSLTGKRGIVFQLSKHYGYAEISQEGRAKYVKITEEGKKYVEDNKVHYTFIYGKS